MHCKGAEWLLSETREKEERVSVLMEALGVEVGQTVCDLGCGNGDHALRLARRVGVSSKVLAGEIQQPVLEERSRDAGIGNIQSILVKVTDPKIREASCDLILLVGVYYEFSDPEKLCSIEPLGIDSFRISESVNVFITHPDKVCSDCFVCN